MARITDEQSQLWNALTRVKLDAKKQKEYHEKELTSKPLHGWDKQRHEEYHKRQIAECDAVLSYCFVRQMQINPD